MREGADLPGAVLFACSRNAVRSPMAAAILKHLAGRRIYVDSAGVRAGEPDPFAVSAMEELGIDLSRHRPQALEALADISFDLIVSLSPEAHKSDSGTKCLFSRLSQSPTCGVIKVLVVSTLGVLGELN